MIKPNQCYKPKRPWNDKWMAIMSTLFNTIRKSTWKKGGEN